MNHNELHVIESFHGMVSYLPQIHEFVCNAVAILCFRGAQAKNGGVVVVCQAATGFCCRVLQGCTDAETDDGIFRIFPTDWGDL